MAPPINPSSQPGPRTAVVMGLTVTGLAAARALGRRGVRVVGAHGGANPPAASSRHLTAVRSPTAAEPDKLLRFYVDLAVSLGGRPVLLPTGDRNVRFLSEHRERLAKHFAFSVCDPLLLDTMSSKRDFVALARQHDLPIPATVLPADRAELVAALERIEPPYVVKPEFTHLWQAAAVAAAGVRGAKAVPAPDRETVLQLYDRLAPIDPRLVVQRMIVGPDENHLSYLGLVEPDGCIRAEFVTRKLRTAPAHYGMSSLAESFRSEEVCRLGRSTLLKLGYRGLGGAQFKRDQRDSRLYLVEMGVRFSLYTALPVACGVDFPYFCFRSLRGEPFAPPTGYPAGHRWWNPFDDLRAMKRYVADGSWNWSGWLRSVARPHTNALFAWDDPVPGVVALGRTLAGSLRGATAPRAEPPRAQVGVQRASSSS